MIGQLIFSKDGKLITPGKVSLYSPPKAVAELTAAVKKDYTIGHDIMNRAYYEFGELLSPVDVMERDQKAFNSFEISQFNDPDEQWRWKGVRPNTRNKIISIAAYFVAKLFFPNIIAQNDDDEEDKNAANIMKDLVEYNIENSNYKISYLFGIIAALVNPVSYLNIEFVEAVQKVKEKLDNGEITTKEAIDEVLSGLNFNNVPMDEVYIANAYEYELQKQRFIIRRRLIDYEEAKGRYGDHDNFDFVKPGVKILYDSATQTFFDVADEDNPTLVEEVIYYNRQEDLEVPFVNGVYMGEEDVEQNMIRHRRIVKQPNNKFVLVPMYPYVKFGYGPIDERRFYFYKSAVNELGPQRKLVDRMWQMVMDGTFLQVIPPVFVQATKVIKSSVFYPGAVHNLQGHEAQIQPISTGANLAAGYNAITMAEQDINQTSRVSQLPAKSGTTAFEVAQEQQQARINLGLFGAMVAEMVTQLGELLVDVILQHQTIAEVDEITAGQTRMRFKNFVLSNKIEDGRKITKQIHFTDEELQGSLEESFKMFEEEGGLDADKRLFKVNTAFFRRLKFLVQVEPELLMPKNEVFEKALGLEFYDRFNNHPLVEQEVLVKETMELFKKGESAKYLKKETGMSPEQLMTNLQSGSRSPRATAPENVVSQITGQGRLASLLRS